jgi:hypothetical protein
MGGEGDSALQHDLVNSPYAVTLPLLVDTWLEVARVPHMAVNRNAKHSLPLFDQSKP